MGLRSFFHKIKIGFTRMGEPSIPYTTEAKKYGDWGEDEFVYAIQSRLPDCKIKKLGFAAKKYDEIKTEIDKFIDSMS